MWYINYATRNIGNKNEVNMGDNIDIRGLRESTGMNRKEFCEFFQIPYRTVTDWERGTRHAPDYVLRLLDYYIRIERLAKENLEND